MSQTNCNPAVSIISFELLPALLQTEANSNPYPVKISSTIPASFESPRQKAKSQKKDSRKFFQGFNFLLNQASYEIICLASNDGEPSLN